MNNKWYQSSIILSTLFGTIYLTLYFISTFEITVIIAISQILGEITSDQIKREKHIKNESK